MASGIFFMPKPSATRLAKGSETWRNEDTMRSRIAGTVTLDNSNRKAAAMWACSTGVWLSKNSFAWV